MNDERLKLADRAGFWGRIIAMFIAMPVYFSLLPTLPALAAVLVVSAVVGGFLALSTRLRRRKWGYDPDG